MSLFKDTCSLSDAHLLQLFNLQREQVDTIDIAHKPDGMYATIKLMRKEQTCPSCEYKTSTIKDYTTKKSFISLRPTFPVLFIIKRGVSNVLPVPKHFMSTTLSLIKI